ncbi:MAG: Matrixin, partial [Eubacteriaceae bacterium]
MLVSLSCSVLAYDTFNDHVLKGGVGNYGYNKRYFYIASSASGYTTYINYAMNDWIYTTSRLGITTPISWRRTYTQSSSVMDFHVTSRYDTGIFAATTFWRYSTQYNPYYSNWGWGKIEIETDLNS